MTVDDLLGDRTVRGKICQVQESRALVGRRMPREVRTKYPIPFPSFIEKKETLSLTRDAPGISADHPSTKHRVPVHPSLHHNNVILG